MTSELTLTSNLYQSYIHDLWQHSCLYQVNYITVTCVILDITLDSRTSVMWSMTSLLNITFISHVHSLWHCSQLWHTSVIYMIYDTNLDCNMSYMYMICGIILTSVKCNMSVRCMIYDISPDSNIKYEIHQIYDTSKV